MRDRVWTSVLIACLLLSGCILSNDTKTECATYKRALLTIVDEVSWLNVVEEELVHFNYCHWCGAVQEMPIDEDVAYPHEDDCPVRIAQLALSDK